MQTHKKIIALTAILSIIAIFSFALMQPMNNGFATNTGLTVNAREGSNIHWIEASPNGQTIAQGQTHNLVTDLGANATLNQILAPNSEKAIYGYLSTNATAPSAAWTYVTPEITGGGLDRATGSITYNSNANDTVTWTWTANATTTGINTFAVGLSNTVGSQTDLFAAFSFSVSLNFASGDTLTVTQTDTVTGS
jgi:hypothetical protein